MGVRRQRMRIGIVLGPDRELLHVVGRKAQLNKIFRNVAARIVEGFAGTAVMCVPVARHHDRGPIGKHAGGEGLRRKQGEDRAHDDRTNQSLHGPAFPHAPS